MKKSTLHFLNALTTEINLYKSKVVKTALFVILMLGMSNSGFSQIIINLSTPATIATASVCPSATNVNLYEFTLSASSAGPANGLTGVTFTQSGTAVVPTDIIQYKLWKNGGSGTGTLVATSTTTSFTGIVGETYPGGTTTNYWITADIAAVPTTGRTITVNTMTTGNLTVTGPGGTSGAGTVAGGTQKISIVPSVTGISGNTPLCVGGTLTLTATGSNGPIGAYNWTGPAGYSSASPTNTQTYVVPATSATGVYSMTITSSGVGCVNNTVYTTGTITVNNIPTVGGITALPTPICAGNTLTLTATGGVTGPGVLSSYNWTGPGGYSASSATSPHNYVVPNSTASGVYSLSVTYPGSGCTSATQSSAPVTVNQAPVLNATSFICRGGTTTLSTGNTTGTWTSSSSSVATVNPNTGAISSTTLGGTTTITNFTACGTASSLATVAARPAGIYGPNSLPGFPGGTQAVCTGKTITLSDATTGGIWSSGTTSIASVVAAGPANVATVTGGNIAPGSGAATIIYTSSVNGCDTSLVVDVNPTPFPITGTDTVCKGSQVTLNDITPLGTWSSSNTSIATVTLGPGSGIVTGVNAGLDTIKFAVVATGCFVTQTVAVRPLPAPITGDSIVCDNLCTTVSDVTAGGTWSSQVPTVAYVGGPTNPTVCGSTPGTTNIIYQIVATGCSIARLMQVNQHPGPITGPTQVCAGNTITLMDAVPNGTWSTANSAVAIVDSNLGVVYGQYGPPTAQTTNIFYDLPACTAVSYSVTVNPAPGPITGVPNVCVGFKTYLSDTTAGGRWTNSGPSYIAIPTGGVGQGDTVLGVSPGSIVDTYTLISTGCFDTIIVLVNPNPDSIRDAMGHIIHFDTVCQGAKVTLVDSTPGGTWSSTILGISQIIDSSGVDSGISAGNVNISYTLTTGCYMTIPFTVKPPVVASVSIGQSPGGIICAGMIDTFTAIPLNGGIPTYQWYKFVTPEGTASTYIDASTNGDLVVVKMNTHFSCAIDTVVYDSLILDVYPVNTGPSVVISCNPVSTTATYLGEVYTFFANVTWGGLSPSYQWYLNGTPIPGATSSSYSTPVYGDGNYYCAVTGVTPCNGTATTGNSNILTIHASYLDVGVDPLTISSANLELFPNPSTGNIVLSGIVNADSKDDLKLEVSDMLGHIVYHGSTTPQNGVVKGQIGLENLSAGVYLLHVNSESVNRVFRFVISK